MEFAVHVMFRVATRIHFHSHLPSAFFSLLHFIQRLNNMLAILAANARKTCEGKGFDVEGTCFSSGSHGQGAAIQDAAGLSQFLRCSKAWSL